MGNRRRQPFLLPTTQRWGNGMAKLTTKFIENVKPADSRREIPDGGCRGLYLIVQPTGRKAWAVCVIADRPCLAAGGLHDRSEEHTSELQSHLNLVCRLLLEK